MVGILGGAYWLSVPDQDLLTPYKFTPLRITSVTTLTPETSLFKVALPKAMLDPTDTGSANAIRSIYVMQPDLQIQRPYTVSSISYPACVECALTPGFSL